MIHQTVIGGAVDAAQSDGVFIIYEDLKILPRLEMHLLPNSARQNNLTFL